MNILYIACINCIYTNNTNNIYGDKDYNYIMLANACLKCCYNYEGICIRIHTYMLVY